MLKDNSTEAKIIHFYNIKLIKSFNHLFEVTINKAVTQDKGAEWKTGKQCHIMYLRKLNTYILHNTFCCTAFWITG